MRGGWCAPTRPRCPFPNESFDVVTAAYLLHLLDPPARRAVIAEAARVLRPGGRMVTVTVGVPRSAPLALAFAPVAAIARRSRWHHGGIARAGSTW